MKIENATVEAVFGDSSLDDHQLSAAGGIVGSSLNSLTVGNSKVYISGSLTPTPVGIGVLQGFVKSGTPAYTNIQVKADLAYGDKTLVITAENVNTDTELYGPAKLDATKITYWTK